MHSVPVLCASLFMAPPPPPMPPSPHPPLFCDFLLLLTLPHRTAFTKMTYPMHDNTVPPYYQTLPHNEDEGHGRACGPRLGNRGVLGTHRLPVVDESSHDGRGVIVETQEWWACEPVEGKVRRVKLLKSDTVAIIPAPDRAHTEVVMPRHLLVEHRNNWVIEVTAKAIYVALAVTETPQDVLARLGFEWEEDAGKYIALDGVSFTKQDCQWWLSWDVPRWDLIRVLRFRHFRGNCGGCLDIESVVHTAYPRDGDLVSLDLVAMYD